MRQEVAVAATKHAARMQRAKSGRRQQEVAAAATKCSAGRTAPKRQAATPLLTAPPRRGGIGLTAKVRLAILRFWLALP